MVLPAHRRLGGLRHAGDTDSRHVEVTARRTDMGGVGRGAAAARFVTGE